MKALKNSRERTRFFRFMVVGVFGAVVDFGTFNLLTSVFGVPEVIAQTFSFLAAVVSNFIWNRFWTYPDSRSKPVLRQAFEFTLINVAGWLVRTPIFAGLLGPLNRLFERLSLPGPFNPEFLGNNLSLAIAVAVVMFWNFFVNRYWTYSDVE